MFSLWFFIFLRSLIDLIDNLTYFSLQYEDYVICRIERLKQQEDNSLNEDTQNIEQFVKSFEQQKDGVTNTKIETETQLGRHQQDRLERKEDSFINEQSFETTEHLQDGMTEIETQIDPNVVLNVEELEALLGWDRLEQGRRRPQKHRAIFRNNCATTRWHD